MLVQEYTINIGVKVVTLTNDNLDQVVEWLEQHKCKATKWQDDWGEKQWYIEVDTPYGDMFAAYPKEQIILYPDGQFENITHAEHFEKFKIT